MRVLLVTQYFYPENFKSNDIAFELVKRGYDVTVLTGIPNYPTGRFFKGYGLFKNRTQSINGVKVKRSFLFSRGNGGGIRLALNYFSWAFFASIDALFLALFHKYDAILVHEPSPITQGFPALIVKKIQRIPLYFWVLDLWPESLTSAGGVTNQKVLSFFTSIVRLIYNNSDKILISSRGFRESIVEKGDYGQKLIYYPNWAEKIFEKTEGCKLPEIPEGFVVMFAGNIGEAQDFDNIMRAALLLKDDLDIKFVFVGDGRKKGWVDSFVREHQLEKTVYVLGRFPLDFMPSFFQAADVMLLMLKDELIFNLTVPAKLQAYMAAGKPIVAMINGEGAAIIQESGCGFAVRAGDYKNLAGKIKALRDMPLKDRAQLGLNGKLYCNKNFSLDGCIDHLCNELKS